MKRVISEVFPTLCSPKNTNLNFRNGLPKSPLVDIFCLSCVRFRIAFYPRTESFYFYSVVVVVVVFIAGAIDFLSFTLRNVNCKLNQSQNQNTKKRETQRKRLRKKERDEHTHAHTICCFIFIFLIFGYFDSSRLSSKFFFFFLLYYCFV